MNDLRLGSATHDLDIVGGDLILLNREAQVATQTLEINLLTLRGEWFADTTIGIPYIDQITRKGASKQFVDTLFQTAILDSYRVSSILSFDSVIGTDRVYRINEVRALTTDGEIISITNVAM